MRVQLTVLIAGFLVSLSTMVMAQEVNPSSTLTVGGQDSDYQQQISADQSAIQAERQTMEATETADQAQNKDLIEAIHEAERSGDVERADSLKEQLRAERESEWQTLKKDEKTIRADRRNIRHELRAEYRKGAGRSAQGRGQHGREGHQGRQARQHKSAQN